MGVFMISSLLYRFYRFLDTALDNGLSAVSPGVSPFMRYDNCHHDRRRPLGKQALRRLFCFPIWLSTRQELR